MRRKLREFYTEDERLSLYSKPYDCFERGSDHIERVAVTAGLAIGAVQRYGLRSAADLSCGTGTLLETARRVTGISTWTGDLVPTPRLDTSGPIEQTIKNCPEVDLFVCSETLEHLEDPDSILKGIRSVSRYLILSTPDGENNSLNPEHYWSWESADVREMLGAAGFAPQSLLLFTPTPRYYTFQVWLASRKD